MLAILSGSGKSTPEYISKILSLFKVSFSDIKSSPKMTATLRSNFCSLINSRKASAHAFGFTPPAFDNILIF